MNRWDVTATANLHVQIVVIFFAKERVKIIVKQPVRGLVLVVVIARVRICQQSSVLNEN